MGRELQKRKARSSRPKIRQHNSKKKPLNPMGNSIVAKNWNKKQTLSQNYRRLGLVAKLGRVAGGVEPDARAAQQQQQLSQPGPPRDNLASKPLSQQIVSEARVERDESGRIVRVLDDSRRGPLNDPLCQFDSDNSDDGEEEEWGGVEETVDEESRPAVIRELERQAGRPTEKRVRHPSEQEVEWLKRLVGRHGGDEAAMARDMRLNPMQQTRADISRRLRTWRACGGEA